MKLNATDLRKRLFSVLEMALRGEPVEVSYKGASLRISAAGAKSKLARAKPQKVLLCDPQDIVHSDRKLLAKLEAGWRKDWAKI